MSKASALLCLLAALLAGCATGPRRDGAQEPWGDNTAPIVTLPPPVSIAPPPTAPPAPPLRVNPPPVLQPTLFTNHPAEIWVPLLRWAKTSGLPAPTHLTHTTVPTYACHSANGTLLLHAGSQMASWNGLELWLGCAPQMIGGQPCVHWIDLQQALQPLLCNAPGLPLGPSPVVVIDPGHGGENTGTGSVLKNHFEKELTLDWARRLQTLLISNGWRAILTRTSDVDLSLSNRVVFAQEHKADLFLSLHFNSAAPDQTRTGFETYCLTPAGLPSNLTRGYADESWLVFPNNAFDAQNLSLALGVHRALLQVSGSQDRGVRRARFPGVLRGQQRPAILVEGGYLSNPHEARLIADPAYRQKLAEAVARGLGCNPPVAAKVAPAAKRGS